MSIECRYARPIMVDDGYKVGLYTCSKKEYCDDKQEVLGQVQCYMMLELYHINRLNQSNVPKADAKFVIGSDGRRLGFDSLSQSLPSRTIDDNV